MAARGRRANRVTVHTKSGTPIFRMGLVEAERLKDAGDLTVSRGIWSRTEFQLKTPLSPVNLTQADMHGVVMGWRRSLLRLKHWPTEHDRRNVTIIAGRGVWVPDPEAATMRARLAEQLHRAKRYADAARN